MDIYQFLDPYLVLQNYYQLRKKEDSQFSYTVWANELDMRSSSTLRMMVNGKKKLSHGVAEKFAQRINATDRDYFKLLIAYAHASTTQERSAAWSALSKILAGRIEQKEAADYFTFISDLLLPKLQTLLSFDDLNWDEETLVAALNVEPETLMNALKKLEQTGMIESVRTPNDKTLWKSTSRLIKVGDKIGDVAMIAYHNASLDEAKEAQRLPAESRRYRSLIVPLSSEELQQIKEEINIFIKQILSKYQSDHYKGRRLFKINLNYFPVSEEVRGNAEAEIKKNLVVS